MRGEAADGIIVEKPLYDRLVPTAQQKEGTPLQHVMQDTGILIQTTKSNYNNNFTCVIVIHNTYYN